MDKISRNPHSYRWVILIAFLFIVSSKVNAQFYAVKVDVLGLATTTLNVEGAVVLDNQWTIHLPVKVNPWKFGDKIYRHVTIMPGVRYWLVESYSRGWFIGANVVATLYNQNGFLSDRMNFFARDYRYEGYGVGASGSAGISLPISKRWNFEFEMGVVGIWQRHDIYDDKGIGPYTDIYTGYQKGLYVWPKLSANIVYLF